MLKSLVAALSLSLAAPVAPIHFTMKPAKAQKADAGTANTPEDVRKALDVEIAALLKQDNTVFVSRVLVSIRTGQVAVVELADKKDKNDVVAVVFIYKDGQWILIPDILYSDK